MVNNQGQLVMHRRGACATTRRVNAPLTRSGQALSTMIVVPQIGLPLLLV